MQGDPLSLGAGELLFSLAELRTTPRRSREAETALPCKHLLTIREIHSGQKPLLGRAPQRGQGFPGWGRSISLPAPGEVWWQAPALSRYVFMSQWRKARRRRRGTSTLSREASEGETYPCRFAGLRAACLPPAVPPLRAVGVFLGKTAQAMPSASCVLQ